MAENAYLCEVFKVQIYGYKVIRIGLPFDPRIIIFKQPISVAQFRAIMQAAEDRADNFLALSEDEFLETHGIASFNKIHSDYQCFREN
jgi:hypothetical protein